MIYLRCALGEGTLMFVCVEVDLNMGLFHALGIILIIFISVIQY